MRLTFLLFLSLSISLGASSQNPDYLDPAKCNALFNESYGTHERNIFDLILPKDEDPHALIIYVHGGGFTHGDKTELYSRKEDILHFLDNNIAVATINYRYFRSDDSLGVKVCIDDVTRALQYLRFHAKKYNIDKERVGMYGTSAGAGSVLYLAFHDEMAVEGNPTLLGESTRIKFGGALHTQATYDIFAWRKFIPFLRSVELTKRRYFYNSIANFYGYPDYKSFKPNRKEITASLDMLALIDPKDPPIYLKNTQKGRFPKNIDLIEHHRKHVIAVARVLEKNSIEHQVYTYKDLKGDPEDHMPFREFAVSKLK